MHKNVPELLNIQNVNGEAKPYQIKQFLRLVERYNLKMGAEEEGEGPEQENDEL